jgi:hypothetical protein
MFKLQFVYLEPRNKNEEQLNEKLNYLSRSILCSCVSRKEDVSAHCKMDKGISQLPNYEET